MPKRQSTRRTPAVRPARGRPPLHQESWSKVSVVLFDRQIECLSQFARTRRRGRAFNRAEIIRALIDALLESGLDVGSSTSEADLRARIARRLATPFR